MFCESIQLLIVANGLPDAYQLPQEDPLGIKHLDALLDS